MSLGTETPRPGRSGAVELAIADVKSVALGWRASKLIGRTVANDQDENIGKLDDLIVDQDRVLFVIVGVGGFLGLGDRKVAIPYRSLDVTADRIVLPAATKDALKALPEFKYPS